MPLTIGRLLCGPAGLWARSFCPLCLLSLMSLTITSCLWAKVFGAFYLELYLSITGLQEPKGWGPRSEQGMPFIPPRPEKHLFLPPPRWECVEIITTRWGLIAVAQSLINAGWCMYMLPCGAAQRNSTLPVCFWKLDRRVKVHLEASPAEKFLPTHVELKQGTGGPRSHKGVDYVRRRWKLSTCIFLNLFFSAAPPPSPKFCWPSKAVLIESPLNCHL